MSVTIADLNYIVPTRERPRSFTYAPTDGSPRSTVVTKPHRLQVQDLRQEGANFTLDGEGFALVGHRSKVNDFTDESQIRTVYYPEAEQLLKHITGADRVFIFDHTLRHRVPGQEDYATGPRQPATRVHVDHTAKSGPQRVRDLLPDEADELLKGRVQVINLWRPINHPVYDAPLAVAEAPSVRFAELVPSDLVYRNRVGETYNVLFSPEHRWHYVRQQRPEEVLLIKCYDSRTDVARFAPHTAFLEPNVPAGAPPRESIELRTLVFHRE
ncbi:MAG TPA: CmcJ/NvfI family oxidoreductase [Rhodopila sp.]|nr:CmcJ/NvfI family oxidoreductase [Rhodopila sp.]